LSWAENSKLDPCIERYFETTHTAAATAEAPARQGTECWVQWMQMGYICWHLDWLDDSGGCKCFSVDRWGDTRHELSAVADGWMESFSKKTNLATMARTGDIYTWADRNLWPVHTNGPVRDRPRCPSRLIQCTHVFLPVFFTRPSWHTGDVWPVCDPYFDGRVRVAIRLPEGHPWWAPTISMNDAVDMSIEIIQRLTSRYPPS